LLTFGVAAPAWADQPLWELGLGAGTMQLPHYRGSDQSHELVLPIPYAVYRGKVLRATREGARAVLAEGGRFEFDLSLAASAPARSSNNLARAGMPDLAATMELGPNLQVHLWRGATWQLDLRLPVRGAFTLSSHPQSVGWTASPVLNLDVDVAGWDLGAQAGPLFASQRHHAYYYDVAPAYANATRPAYSASGGASGWRISSGASRRFGDLWVGAFVRADSVAGAVFEPSPLVKQRHNLSFGLALSWVFKVSDERVPDER
jgi:outer membrane scaffolding protein for murein synthesis (MipA/OmpV family)